MSLKTAAIPIHLALAFLRDLADSLAIFLIITQGANFQPGVSTHSILIHFFLGMALAGLSITPSPKNSDLILAPLGNFLLTGLLSLSIFTRFFVDPVFLGFVIGLGRNAFVPGIPFSGGLKPQNRFLLAVASKEGLIIAFTLAWFISSKSHLENIQDAFKYPIAFQALACLATMAWFVANRFFTSSPIAPSNPQEKESFEDDIIPRCLNSLFQGLVLGGSCALAIGTLSFKFLMPDNPPLFIGLSIGAGILLGLLTSHPNRCIGLVPISCLTIGSLFLFGQENTFPLIPCILIVTITHLLMICQRASRPEHPPAGKISVLISAIGPWLIGIATLELIRLGIATPKNIGIALLLLSPFLAWLLLRALLEEGAALVSMIFSRPVAHGPGPDQMPARGPVILISNHCSYMDPFWIGKVVPRHITPMMTSLFYDLPGVRWLMKHVTKAIRVEASAFRREAPELEEAAKVLKNGGCLLIFPEGRLRRKEEQLLFPFGQGAYLLIRQFPNVPVYPIWIEGSWGSMMSYFNGPPFTNKKIDIRRPIQLGIGQAIQLPPDILENQRACRAYLQDAVLASRKILGLKAPAMDSPESPGEDREDLKVDGQKTT